MPQIINTNIASINAQRNLDKSQSANQQALQRLSSGLRINSAKDDAAGLAISTRFTSQIKGLNVATRNAGDGIALAQTAEGALGSINDSLQRIRELAVQSANATNSDVDRDALQAEVDQLVAEISRTAEETDFNGRTLLDGSFNATFQVGANAGQTVDVSIAELTADKLGASDASGVSANGVNAALSNGDLSINGVDVLASQANDDTASTKDAASSSIAKAAAINRISDQTGVTAFVNENTAVGTKQVAAQEDGTLTLNGVAISLQTSTDAAASRASVVEAINAVSDQTGVTAVDTGSSSSGVELVAADGRNIDVVFDGFTNDTVAAQATGLAEQNTYVGGYTLVSEDGPINIEGGDGSGLGNLANSGLTEGVYDNGVASAVTNQSDFGTTVGSLSTQLDNSFVDNGTGGTALAQDFTVSVTVGDNETRRTGVLTTGVNDIDSIAVLADDINTNIAGVTAYEEINGTLARAAGAAAGETIDIGGTTFTLATADKDGILALADAINAFNFGTNFDVSATAGTNATDIELSIKNYSGAAFTIGTGGDNNGDFTFEGNNLTAASDDTVTGVLKYFSDDGSDVSVQISRDVDTAGDDLLANGVLSASGTTYSGPNGLGEGDLTINGVAIASAKASSDTASATVASDGTTILSSSKETSAISVAAAINEVSDETGVTAEAQATKVVGNTGGTSDADTAGFETGDQGELYINGVNLGNVTLADTGNGTTIDTDKAKADAITLINQSAGKTGVTAVDNGTSITLTAEDGRNISVAINDKSGNDESASGIGALFGLSKSVAGIGESTFGDVGTASRTSAEALTYETTVGKVKLSSASEFEVNVGTNGKAELDALGFQAGTFGGGEDGQFLKDIDISTFEGAQSAITAIDNAIGQVASQRADLGAIQNRLESTVSNLQITSENLNAANSRIQDADFAAETAELQRTNVLQQAGISVLAQANAAGQQVLSLLG